jgi:hypothetical protein
MLTADVDSETSRRSHALDKCPSTRRRWSETEALHNPSPLLGNAKFCSSGSRVSCLAPEEFTPVERGSGRSP